jgi:hypothetical protein
MLELPEPEKIKELIALLAPGFLILSIRGAVQGGPKPALKELATMYAVVSAVYYAMAFPVFHWRGGLTLEPAIWAALQYVAIPAAIGVFAAYEAQNDWLAGVAAKLRLYLAHPIPAAWDYSFSKLRAGTFVLVTLEDRTQIPGLIGQHSFASSSKEERDLLIEELWEISPQGQWTKATPPRSILLCGKNVRHIEFFGV